MIPEWGDGQNYINTERIRARIKVRVERAGNGPWRRCVTTQPLPEGNPMSKGTARHAVRIEPELWNAAKQAAASRGDNLSAIIREALSAYVRDMGNPNEHQ